MKLTTDSVNGMGAEIKEAFKQVEKLGVEWDSKLPRDFDEMPTRLDQNA